MTENNSGVWREKFISKKNQGFRHRGGKRKVGVGTLLLGNDKNLAKECYCQLFIQLFFVLKLSGINYYPKGHLTVKEK